MNDVESSCLAGIAIRLVTYKMQGVQMPIAVRLYYKEFLSENCINKRKICHEKKSIDSARRMGWT